MEFFTEVMMPPILVLGTRNAKKRQEIEEILGDLGIAHAKICRYIRMLPKSSRTAPPSRPTHARRRQKRRSRFTNGCWAKTAAWSCRRCGSTRGLFRRYAGAQGDDAANNKKLLAELAKFGPDQRDAYYVCTAALADPSGQIHAVVEGRCHGRIITDYRGQGGFGYDPLFLIPEYHKTFGELSPRVKHALSHRGRALYRCGQCCGRI